jgi:hypothetical protein
MALQHRESDMNKLSADDTQEIPAITLPKDESEVSKSRKQRISDIFTIVLFPIDLVDLQFCAGFALISDGYQNNLMFLLPRSIVDCQDNDQRGVGS